MEKKIVKQYVVTLSEDEYHLLKWALAYVEDADAKVTLSASDTMTIDNMRKVLSNA